MYGCLVFNSSKPFHVCPTKSTKALTLTACQLLTEDLHNLGSLVQHSAFSTNALPCLGTFGKHLPSIALKALADILSEGEIGVSIDGDAVVIVESLSHSKPFKKICKSSTSVELTFSAGFGSLCSLLLSRNNQLSQTQVASICASFVRNSLLHASITCKNL